MPFNGAGDMRHASAGRAVIALITCLLIGGFGISGATNASATSARAIAHPTLRSCDDLADPITSRSRCLVEDPHSHVVMIGTSVTRKAKQFVQADIPYITVDALDGRAWEIPGRPNGTTEWQAFLQYQPQLRPRDWLVMEASRGDISVAMNRTYMDKLIAALPDGVCLAWVIPHVYYSTQTDAQTAAMHTWNTDMAALIRQELAGVPCHAFIEWDSVVTQITQLTPGLTTDQLREWQPLLYDGRHPTAYGGEIYGSTIAVTIDLARKRMARTFHWHYG